MRQTYALALAALSLTISACSIDPCSRDAKLAMIGAGGPIGWAIAELQSCRAAADPTPTAAEPVAILPDMAPAPDMAPPADLTTPPDLTRAPEVVDLVIGSAWQLTGGMTALGDGRYHCPAGFDFPLGRASVCALDIPLVLPPGVAHAQTITLSYSFGASLAWGPPSADCSNQGFAGRFQVRQGSTVVCVPGSVGAGLVIDGSDVPLRGGMPAQLPAPPAGVSYPITQQSRVALRLQVVGDVEISGLSAGATTTMTF